LLHGTSRADLTSRLRTALEVAARAVAVLGAAGYQDPDDPSLDVSGEKVVAETAMLLHAASHLLVEPGIRERVRTVAELLVGPARSDAVLAHAALHPSLAEGLAVPHVLLTRLGHPDPEVDSFFRSCIASTGARGHELPAYGALEKLWLRDLWGTPAAAGEWRRVLRGSVLRAPLDLIGGQREDSYAFTHTLMYMSDFGAKKRRLPRPLSRVIDDARALLAVCLERSDYDLVGEILMAWPFFGMRWCASASFVFRLLMAVEDEAGLLPGGTTNADRLHTLTGERRRLYALATAYHTAYVMGILCAASLRPRRRAPSPIHPKLLDRVDSVDEGGLAVEQPHVREALSALPRWHYERLAAFRLDLAIAQAVRHRRYQQLAELVTCVDESGRGASVLLVQAKELLVRLALGLSPRIAAAAVYTES